MILETLRDIFIDLEQRGNLIRVSKTVDINWEVGCLVKWMFRQLRNKTVRASGLKTLQGTTFQLSLVHLVPLPIFTREFLVLNPIR